MKYLLEGQGLACHRSRTPQGVRGLKLRPIRKTPAAVLVAPRKGCVD